MVAAKFALLHVFRLPQRYFPYIEENEVVFSIEATLHDNSKEVIPESEYELFKQTVTFKSKETLKDVKSLEFSVWKPE